MNIKKIKEYTFYVAIILTLMPLLSPFSFNFSYGDLLLLLLFMSIFFTKKGLVLNIFSDWFISIAYFSSVITFLLGFAISTVVNGGASNFFLIFFQYFVLLIILPLLFVNIPLDFKKLVKSILVSITVTIFFGYYIYFFTSSIDFSIGGRMGSLFKNPNIFAKNIAVIIPLSLLYAYSFKEKKGFLSFFIMLAGLLIASSFGGIISSVISFSLFFLFSLNIKKMLKVLSIAVLAVTSYVIIFGLPNIFEERILPVISSGNLRSAGSFNDKILLMDEAIHIIANNPFLGLGAGRYVEFNINYFTVHNSYLLVWAEGGIFSFLGFIGILLAFLLKILKNLNNPLLFAAGAAILAALIFNFFTDVHFYNRYTFISLYTVTLLTSKYVEKKAISA